MTTPSFALAGFPIPAVLLNVIVEKAAGLVLDYLSSPENVKKAKLAIRDVIVHKTQATENKWDDRLVEIYDQFVGLK